MLTFQSILCGVDFSEHSRHALRWAVGLAALHRSRLTVVTAVDPLLAYAAHARFDVDLKAETRETLQEFIRGTLPSGYASPPHADVQSCVGNPSAVILESAKAERADLIVLGTHGIGGFRKLLLGSTTDRVLRHTHTALLAVPPHEGGAEGITLGADGPRFSASTIVAATDFSAAAGKALDCAASLAQRHGSRLLLTHVVAPVSVPPRWQSYVEGLDEKAVADARVRLEQISAGLSHPAQRDCAVTVGRPADAIASLAREREAGLIVMGLIGERHEIGQRPGSIAYRVLCLAHVPVLVVPPEP